MSCALTFHKAAPAALSPPVTAAVHVLRDAGFGLVKMETTVATKEITRLVLELEFFPGHGKSVHDQDGVHEFQDAWIKKKG